MLWLKEVNTRTLPHIRRLYTLSRMKFSFLLLALTATPFALAQTAKDAAPPPIDLKVDQADQKFGSFEALRATPPTSNPDATRADRYRAADVYRREISRSAFSFFETYPSDTRRWAMLLAAADMEPLFIRSIGPDVEEKGFQAVDVDTDANRKWSVDLNRCLTLLLLPTSDATVSQREAASWCLFSRELDSSVGNKEEPTAEDFAPFTKRFEEHMATYANEPALAARVNAYVSQLEYYFPDAAAEVWRRLNTASNTAVRDEAARHVRVLEVLSQPIDLTFTAVDGTDVDLGKLRGKVVLVDFWATWCGPCRAEIPNVVAAYSKYHNKGFEVVGISLENASLAPADSPEETTVKLEKARKKLTSFTAAHAMPWPQYFDGKHWKNSISQKYLINAIPATFLLDKEGRLVSTHARGQALDREVGKLLEP